MTINLFSTARESLPALGGPMRRVGAARGETFIDIGHWDDSRPWCIVNCGCCWIVPFVSLAFLKIYLIYIMVGRKCNEYRVILLQRKWMKYILGVLKAAFWIWFLFWKQGYVDKRTCKFHPNLYKKNFLIIPNNYTLVKKNTLCSIPTIRSFALSLYIRYNSR